MRAILTLILGLVAANAMAADWRLVFLTHDGDKWFVDAGSIRINGSMRRAWVLVNLGTPEEDGTQSKRALDEYDCREGRSWFMQLSGHSLPDANGKVTYSYSHTDRDWRYAPPGTVDESMLKFVCARK